MKTLKELRTDYGLTQKELGDLFKVSSRTIQNMEKDSTNIKDSVNVNIKMYINDCIRMYKIVC